MRYSAKNHSCHIIRMPGRWAITASVYIFLASLISLTHVVSAADAYIDGELLIKYKRGFTAAVQSVLPDEYHMKVIAPGIAKVTVDAAKPIAAAIAELEAHPSIEYAQPNYIKRIQQLPDNVRFDIQWGMNNLGQLVPNTSGQDVQGVPDADIDAVEAWNTTTGDRNILIAVIDTGVDLQHPDLIPNLWQNPGEGPDSVDNDNNGYIDDTYGWDFAQDDNFPDDRNGHGTYMSSIIGARSHGALQITGLNWQVSLMILRAFDSQGASNTVKIVNAIRYAVDNGADIINASYGAIGAANQGSGAFDQLEYDAYDYARQNGVLVVAAACNDGVNNDGADSCVPASYDLSNIISVAATDQSDQLADFSNFGSNSVDLGAPGVNIATSAWKDYARGTVTIIDGTSIASAFVSGAAGLILARARTLSKEVSAIGLRDLILDNVDALPNSLGGLVATGGRLNVAQAVAAVESAPAPQQTGPANTQSSSGGGGLWGLPTAVLLLLWLGWHYGWRCNPGDH